MQTINSAMIGNGGRVSGLYVFANGWFGVETEELMDMTWLEKVESGEEELPWKMIFLSLLPAIFSLMTAN